MKKKLFGAAVLVMILGVVVLVGVICNNTVPQEEYELITMTGTVNTTALEVAGYFSIEREGYFKVEEDTEFRRGSCEICEAIQRGEITPTFGLEESDNFTVIMEEGAYDLNKPVIKFYPNNTHNISVEIITSEE